MEARLFVDKINETNPDGVAIIFQDQTGNITNTMITQGCDPEQFIVSSRNRELVSLFPEITLVDTDIVQTVIECEDPIRAVWLSANSNSKSLIDDISTLINYFDNKSTTLLAIQFNITDEIYDRNLFNKILNAGYTDKRRFQTSKILNYRRGHIGFWIYKLEPLKIKKRPLETVQKPVKRARMVVSFSNPPRSSSLQEEELNQRLEFLEKKLQKIYDIIGRWD